MFFSIVIATHKRVHLLKDCLASIFKNDFSNYEIIIAHSGADDGTEEFIASLNYEHVSYLRCKQKGAASQRNEGVNQAKGNWVIFFDDDVIVDHQFLICFEKCILENPEAKGVSGLISNQNFEPLGLYTRFLLMLLGVKGDSSIAGKVVGPCLNFLPSSEGDKYQRISWMPTCVCGYDKKFIMDIGLFPDQFKGYSFGEDLYLSHLVSQSGELWLAREAILYHKDIGSNSHPDYYEISKMQVDNRNFINYRILKQNKILFNIKLMVWNVGNLFAQFVHGNINLNNTIKSIGGFSVGFFKNLWNAKFRKC